MKSAMEKSSMHLSEKEKDAVTIERAVNDLEFAKYMENKVGEVYDGLIVGVTSFGFFVELDNTVEGMVPLRNMIDDFYNYDADTMMLTGENTGKTFTLGMPVRIKVRDVQTAKRQITFDYLETLPSRSAMRPSTPVIETAEPKPEEQPEEEILQAEIVSEETRCKRDDYRNGSSGGNSGKRTRLPRRILKKPKICLPSKRRMTICRR